MLKGAVELRPLAQFASDTDASTVILFSWLRYILDRTGRSSLGEGNAAGPG